VKKPNGFTMVEVIIVVAIIAIMASIIVPKMSGARDSSKLTACKANLKHIAVAMELYANENYGMYCESTAEGIYFNSSCKMITGGYLKRVPLCPSAPRSTEWCYFYARAGDYIYCHSYWNDYNPTHAGLRYNRPIFYLHKGTFQYQ